MTNLYKVNGTGVLVDLLNLRPKDVSLDTIELSLSRLYRFGGTTIVPYTVLDHTVIGTIVCEHLGFDENVCKSFLCHDLVEGVMGFDCPSPIKKICPALTALEHKINANLEKIYGFTHIPEAKQVDYLMQFWEAFYLTKGRGQLYNPDYWETPELEAPLCLHDTLGAIREGEKIDFKQMFKDLCGTYGVKDA